MEEPLYVQIIKKQIEVSNNLGWTKSNDNYDLFYLLPKITTDEPYINLNIKYDDYSNYLEFLQFCDEQITNFKTKILDRNFASYKYKYKNNTLTQEEFRKFNEISINLQKNFDEKPSNSLRQTTQSFKQKKIKPKPKPKTLKDLIEKNESILDSTVTNKYFDTMTDDQILIILKERLRQLERCHNKEFNRETTKMTETEVISSLADFIQWSKECFEDDFSNEVKINEIYTKISLNPLEIQRLLLFLPLDLFTIDGQSISLDEIKFKNYLRENLRAHMNIQQLRLGFNDLLNIETIERNIPQLYQLNTLELKIKNDDNCGELCIKNMRTQLLQMYMSSRSLSKVFPISFKLPSKDLKNPDSHSFRNLDKYESHILFDKTKCKFLGVHLLKYIDNKGHQKILILFTFKNNQFGLPLEEQNEDNFDLFVPQEIYSIFTGKEKEYFNLNFFVTPVEDGQIMPPPSENHQIFYDLTKYYKLRPYILNDNKTELFYTRRSQEDADIRKMIDDFKLNLQEVFIKIFKPVEGGQRRFKILLDAELTPGEKQQIIENEGNYFYVQDHHFILHSRTTQKVLRSNLNTKWRNTRSSRSTRKSNLKTTDSSSNRIWVRGQKDPMRDHMRGQFAGNLKKSVLKNKKHKKTKKRF